MCVNERDQIWAGWSRLMRELGDASQSLVRCNSMKSHAAVPSTIDRNLECVGPPDVIDRDF